MSCVGHGGAGNLRTIPLLVLLALAVAAGAVAAVLGRRYRDPRPAVPRSALRARLDPETLTGLALTIALVLIFGGGVLLAGLAVVVRDTHALAGIDSAVAQWGDRNATSASTDGLRVVTAFGETWMAIAVALVVAAVDWRRTRNRWVVPFLLIVIAGDKLLTLGLKELINRVRPDIEPVAHTLGPSFPSGHSSTAAALWAAVALVASRWWGRRGLGPLAALAVGLPVAVAASRVLLDVHWLTDVVAGLALGWAWFATCAVAFGGRLLRFGAPAEGRAETRRGGRVSSEHDVPAVTRG